MKTIPNRHVNTCYRCVLLGMILTNEEGNEVNVVKEKSTLALRVNNVWSDDAIYGDRLCRSVDQLLLLHENKN